VVFSKAGRQREGVSDVFCSREIFSEKNDLTAPRFFPRLEDRGREQAAHLAPGKIFSEKIFQKNITTKRLDDLTTPRFFMAKSGFILATT
jgi:hypothetical protein